MVLLSVTPLKNHGADTTLVEWEITEVGGEKRNWDATADLVDDLLAGNPHADRHGNKQTWWLLDVRNQPTPLPEAVRDVSGKPGLNVWRNGDTPSVFVNASDGRDQRLDEAAAALAVRPPGPERQRGRRLAQPDHGQGDRSPAGSRTPTPAGRTASAGCWSTSRPTCAPTSPPWRPRRSGTASWSAGGPNSSARPRSRTSPSPWSRARPADARMHLRGDPEKLGDVVPRRWLEVLGGTADHDQGRQRPARPGRLDRVEGQPADRPRDGEPHLAAPLRQGAGEDAERLRHARDGPDAPGAARLARRRVRRARAGASRRCTGRSCSRRRISRPADRATTA